MATNAEETGTEAGGLPNAMAQIYKKPFRRPSHPCCTRKAHRNGSARPHNLPEQDPPACRRVVAGEPGPSPRTVESKARTGFRGGGTSEGHAAAALQGATHGAASICILRPWNGGGRGNRDRA